ncbi:reverse transcriptase [Labeo rohita]|uniref:Reverse transcriptase n=1 Tax=Labeo rohita TaxID=84645 RepID=A0A498NVQ6_LABRO|nr:reverse transcriptase [Labeo rohita]
MHQREEGFTWFSGDGTRASRIDYIFTRDCPPTDATLTPLFFSDHIMLSCTLSLPTGVTVGGGLWKLNCSLLEDEDVVREYREQFSQWQTLQDFYDSRAQWWEMVKERTRQYFRKIGREKKKRLTRRMMGLQKRLQSPPRKFLMKLERAVFYFLWGSKWERLKRDDREPVSPVPGLTLSEAKQVWRNAAHPALQNRHKDLSWMAAHEILPVRAVMHSRGMAKNPTCPRSGCNFPETVRHLLWECGAARDLWAKTGPLYFPCLPAGGAQIGYQLAILGVGRGLKDLTAQDFTSLWLTLNVIKDAIWATRNLLVGKRVTVPLHACELKVTSMLQGYRATIFGRGGRGRTERVPAATVAGRP